MSQELRTCLTFKPLRSHNSTARSQLQFFIFSYLFIYFCHVYCNPLVKCYCSPGGKVQTYDAVYCNPTPHAISENFVGVVFFLVVWSHFDVTEDDGSVIERSSVVSRGSFIVLSRTQRKLVSISKDQDYG